jgi:hypothetical protein
MVLEAMEARKMRERVRPQGLPQGAGVPAVALRDGAEEGGLHPPGVQQEVDGDHHQGDGEEPRVSHPGEGAQEPVQEPPQDVGARAEEGLVEPAQDVVHVL